MKSIYRSKDVGQPTSPIKILQFGEGNFLRAFANWCIDRMNDEIGYDAGVAVVQPIEHGLIHRLQKQDGLYHHIMRGLRNGVPVNETRLIGCIQMAINPFEDADSFFNQAKNAALKVVISNTTEAGIRFQSNDLPEADRLATTFPGKLTQLLKKRFDHFAGSAGSGLVFLPCELIENNGINLKNAILEYAGLWKLGSDFESWIQNSNHFANTLVDRIVPGFPKEEIKEIRQHIEFDDQLVVSSEVFHLWVIQGPKEIQQAFPADEAGLNVKFVNDITPYRTRKVRILNGAHTCMVPLGLLSGVETVKDNVEHSVIGAFIQATIDEEISPTIDLPASELKEFSNEVMERFKNPFIRHELKSIALNSISKFKVRVLPTIKDYIDTNHELPRRLLFSMACLIKLYHFPNFEINDDESIKSYFDRARQNALGPEAVKEILSQEKFWGENLTYIANFEILITEYIDKLNQQSVIKTINSLFL